MALQRNQRLTLSQLLTQPTNQQMKSVNANPFHYLAHDARLLARIGKQTKKYVKVYNKVDKLSFGSKSRLAAFDKSESLAKATVKLIKRLKNKSVREVMLSEFALTSF